MFSLEFDKHRESFDLQVCSLSHLGSDFSISGFYTHDYMLFLAMPALGFL